MTFQFKRDLAPYQIAVTTPPNVNTTVTYSNMGQFFTFFSFLLPLICMLCGS